MSHLLLVDDEPVLREVLGTLLRRNGFSVIEAGSCADALAAFDGGEGDIDLVLLDLMLPDGHGLDVLREIRTKQPETIVIVITAYSSIEGAIEAMREGAFHYIPKPFKNEEVVLTVRRGLEQHALRVENRSLRAELDRKLAFENIVGRSEPMKKIFELIRLAAPSKANILLEGESGTGKQLVARTIHHHSPRSHQPFVAVACAGMPADLLESSLFGSGRGTAPGAPSGKAGSFALASGGTLYFDEIANIPMSLQTRLLNAIQDKAFTPDGATAPVRADVRIIAATSVDLGRLVSEGNFREDLYYRLHVITIPLPPLRLRRDDIPLLARHFASRSARENGKPELVLTPESLRRLVEAPWPGNVRELENALERAVVLCPGAELTPDLFPGSLVRPPRLTPAPFSPSGLPPAGMSLKNAVEEYEREMILRALTLTSGIQKRAAELLQIKPTTLNEMIKRLGISGKNGTE